MRLKWKLVSVCLEIVLILSQDRCTICAECTTGMEIVLGVPHGTLGVVGEVDVRFSPFGDSVNLGARYVYGFHQMHHRLKNHVGCI